MNMWKKLLMGSLVLGTLVSCNGSMVPGMVPVAVTASLEGLSMKVSYVKSLKTGFTTVTVTRNSGTTRFTSLPGSATYLVQRYKIETFDESQAPLGNIEHTLSATILPPPLTGEGAGVGRTTDVKMPQDPIFSDEVEQHYVNLCLTNYFDPNRGQDDPVCPKIRTKVTYTGISMADHSTKNVTAVFDFQPSFSYTVEE